MKVLNGYTVIAHSKRHTGTLILGVREVQPENGQYEYVVAETGIDLDSSVSWGQGQYRMSLRDALDIYRVKNGEVG